MGLVSRGGFLLSPFANITATIGFPPYFDPFGVLEIYPYEICGSDSSLTHVLDYVCNVQNAECKHCGACRGKHPDRDQDGFKFDEIYLQTP